MTEPIPIIEVSLAGMSFIGTAIKWFIQKVRENIQKRIKMELLALVIVEIGRLFLMMSNRLLVNQELLAVTQKKSI